MTDLAFALLADGRLPSGAHAHSGGVEEAVRDGRIRDLGDLEEFVVGRLHTAGVVDAALAAATAVRVVRPAPLATVAEVDAEAEARIAPVVLRVASRRLGRQLARAAASAWPSALLAEVTGAFPGGVHQPVAWGVVGVSAGVAPSAVARLVVHHAISGALQAGLRLLGLDPFAAVAATGRLAEIAEDTARAAVAAAEGPLRDLPAPVGPIIDIAAAVHAGRDGTLFAT